MRQELMGFGLDDIGSAVGDAAGAVGDAAGATAGAIGDSAQWVGDTAQEHSGLIAQGAGIAAGIGATALLGPEAGPFAAAIASDTVKATLGDSGAHQRVQQAHDNPATRPAAEIGYGAAVHALGVAHVGSLIDQANAGSRRASWMLGIMTPFGQHLRAQLLQTQQEQGGGPIMPKPKMSTAAKLGIGVGAAGLAGALLFL